MRAVEVARQEQEIARRGGRFGERSQHADNDA